MSIPNPIYTFLCLFLLSGVAIAIAIAIAIADVTGKAQVTDGDTVKIGDFIFNE